MGTTRGIITGGREQKTNFNFKTLKILKKRNRKKDNVAIEIKTWWRLKNPDTGYLRREVVKWRRETKKLKSCEDMTSNEHMHRECAMRIT